MICLYWALGKRSATMPSPKVDLTQRPFATVAGRPLHTVESESESGQGISEVVTH